MKDSAHHREWHHQVFGHGPTLVVASPGRVNLMGDHTYYNEGYVLPMAIDRGTLISARMTNDGRLRAYSRQQPGMVNVDMDDLREADLHSWSAYLRGPLALLRERGWALPGVEFCLDSDVPLGAGLSSSASVEVGVAQAALSLLRQQLPLEVLASLCQRAERQVAGVNCGIMDMFAIAGGEAGQALLLDCQNLDVTLVPMPAAWRVLILDTHAPRNLAGSAYNDRRASCEAAALVLGLTSLRDATETMIGDPRLSDAQRRCVRHVVSENERVLLTAAALARGDGADVGQLCAASHASLRDDYAVSSAALDAMVAAALTETGVLGARLTGAGFGGCVVAWIDDRFTPASLIRVLTHYRTTTQLEGDGFIVQASRGAGVVWSRS
jgi:galactokinase